MSGREKVVVVCITGIVVLLIIGLFSELPRVTPKFRETTIEVGGTVSKEVRDYLNIEEELLEKAVLDISEVDTSKAGDYKVHCEVLFYNYDFQVHVIDAVVPETEVGKEFDTNSTEEYDMIDTVSKTYELAKAIRTMNEVEQYLEESTIEEEMVRTVNEIEQRKEVVQKEERKSLNLKEILLIGMVIILFVRFGKKIKKDFVD